MSKNRRLTKHKKEARRRLRVESMMILMLIAVDMMIMMRKRVGKEKIRVKIMRALRIKRRIWMRMRRLNII